MQTISRLPVNMPTRLRARADSPIAKSSLWRAVDQEIHRLPTNERVPIVFCCLEGRTLKLVAWQFQCSRAGMRQKLRRGLRRLRFRLAARGWALSGQSLLRLLRQDRLEGVPDRLINETVRRAGRAEHVCRNG